MLIRTARRPQSLESPQATPHIATDSLAPSPQASLASNDSTRNSFGSVLVSTALALGILACLAQSSLAPFTFAQQSSGPPQSPSVDEMFRQLDANQDDKLTLDEGGPGVQQFTKRLFEMTGKAATDSIGRDEFRRIVEQHRRQNGGPARASDSTHSPPQSPKQSPNQVPNTARGPETARMPNASRSPRGQARPTHNVANNPANNVANSAPLQQRLGGVWRGWVVDGRGENPNSGHMELELRIESNRIVGRELGTNRGPAGRQTPGFGGGVAGGSTAGVAGALGDGTFVIANDESHLESGTLDATATGGQHVGREYPGIFRLDGTTLHWCVNNRNGERPTNYETGRGNYYMILRKQP